MEAGAPLPEYVCHKTVSAAKITGVSPEYNGGHDLIFGEIKGSQFITNEWFSRFKPEVGGYYVVYQDGYASFSPAKAFEEGYTKKE